MDRSLPTWLYCVAAIGLLGGCATPMFVATDGSHQDRLNPPYEAAVASAVRDLPCDRSSIAVVGYERFERAGQTADAVPNILEGCGGRVTYEVVHAAEESDVAGRYLMVSRAQISVATLGCEKLDLSMLRPAPAAVATTAP